ncbi:Gcn5-related N-acetyltransferase (GNAT) domain protein [Acididesulfobacillus acetoxydans]|uniref:Acetyltransferase n=1 Tax=Acididesulfobacillus acetoxydans TaxID=1561005 RepID=A0A8S0WZ05_9FIRM|nr:GNAT family N-acetyltransferase [Acididesulfobacillus acetoxydans]CAA7601761.1 Gcn5-related N-acetyltransferase (GNAT) domain protein [Acididesulfobacillus acetoxydans]CEJ09020.1 Acetyltransferase [Acididesulfobacillus acetoxydans]
MLEEVKDMPKKAVENPGGEVNVLKIYAVEGFNLELLKRMVDFSSNIFGESGTREWSLVPQIRHGNVFVLKEEGKKTISGVAILMRDWDDVDKAYLFEYAIAEELQGQGLGYHFLHSICENLKDQGFKRVSLTVDTENEPAIRLYRDKLGFRLVQYRRDEYGPGHDRYIMELELAPARAN